MIYTYIVVETSGGKIKERHGLIESDTPRAAFVNLTSRGFYVREVRVATIEDMKIDRLKRFRDKLVPPLSVIKSEEVIQFRPPRRQMNWMVVVLIIIGCTVLGVIFKWLS
jgi:hypothetical protein